MRCASSNIAKDTRELANKTKFDASNMHISTKSPNRYDQSAYHSAADVCLRSDAENKEQDEITNRRKTNNDQAPATCQADNNHGSHNTMAPVGDHDHHQRQDSHNDHRYESMCASETNIPLVSDAPSRPRVWIKKATGGSTISDTTTSAATNSGRFGKPTICMADSSTNTVCASITDDDAITNNMISRCDAVTNTVASDIAFDDGTITTIYMNGLCINASPERPVAPQPKHEIKTKLPLQGVQVCH